MTNEWHLLEYAVLFASHNVLGSHGGLSHFTVQNPYNIYYSFTPNLLSKPAHAKVLRIHYYYAISFMNNQVRLV
jgi:hypothetical protein